VPYKLFGLQEKKILSAQFKLLPQVCRLMTRVLPPYGASFAALCTSFAALWLVFCRFMLKVLKRSTKV
jgi:hypothetical protein